jgi:osmotically-inducible protein OsmY
MQTQLCQDLVYIVARAKVGRFSAREKERAMKHLIKLVAAVVVIFALAGCQAMTGRTAGENLDDLTITTAVKTRLAADKASTLTRIDVDTVDRVVYLNGVVGSEHEKRRAEDIASLVSNVKAIINNLQVQTAPAP